MPKKLTPAEFILRARQVHGGKYDYSKVDYKGYEEPVEVGCAIHGYYKQSPHSHLAGKGCPSCAGNTKYTNESFIRKANEVHGERYDYSAVNYISSQTKVTIICKLHGPFEQKPNGHLLGQGCPVCAGRQKKTRSQFILDAREIHGYRYDYSKSIYVNDATKLCITCAKHGDFFQTPNSHLRGGGCPKCKAEYFHDCHSFTQQQFLDNARSIHGNKYDYSKAEYYNTHTKVCIICPEHGEFWQEPYCHTTQRCGCPLCGTQSAADSRTIDKSSFIERAQEVHGDKYDYSKVEYSKSNIKVQIVCPEHGDFWQAPSQHLSGQKCPKCANAINAYFHRKDFSTFLEQARKAHGNKYDYSLTEYKSTEKKVAIMCPTHGLFYQTPANHIKGVGCPSCNESHLERLIQKLLSKSHIAFDRQKTFPWLKSNGQLYLDFFLPDYGVAIECQGRQHFISIGFFGGQQGLQNLIQRDSLKKRLCEEHGIAVLYYSNLGIKYPYPVIEDPVLLLNAIQDKGLASDSVLWSDPELPFNY